MKKIFDSHTFYPQEDIGYYLDPKKIPHMSWGEPLTEKELLELFEEWPAGTKASDVFPHCAECFIYPNLDDNIYLYRELTETKDFKGLFDPLDFFNLLYEQLKYCLDRVNIDTQRVIDHLIRINLVKRKLHFFLYSLHYLIKGLNGSVTADRMWPDEVTTLRNKKLGRIHIAIIDTYQGLEKELNIETENTDLLNIRPQIMPDLIDMKNPHNLNQGKLISIKPIFAPDSVEFIYNVLVDSFSKEHQPELKRILTTGDNSNELLLFKDNGNRLMDVFKKLFEHNNIIGCQKKDLALWIVRNFLYQHRDYSKHFSDDYVKKGISRNDYPCKFPLIEIKNGKIQKTATPKNKGNSKKA